MSGSQAVQIEYGLCSALSRLPVLGLCHPNPDGVIVFWVRQSKHIHAVLVCVCVFVLHCSGIWACVPGSILPRSGMFKW